jgi:hypothetical protein
MAYPWTLEYQGPGKHWALFNRTGDTAAEVKIEARGPILLGICNERQREYASIDPDEGVAFVIDRLRSSKTANEPAHLVVTWAASQAGDRPRSFAVYLGWH